MAVDVSPMNSRNTHHVKLSDGVTDLGLILCNRDGDQNVRSGFSSDPVVRSSIKMYSGEQRHSDLEPPWVDVAQDDWSGGRGSEKYELDTSRYWDGRQVDTTNNGIVLAPMDIFERHRTIKNNNLYWPIYGDTTYARNKYTSYSLVGSSRCVAVSFSPGGNYTAAYIMFYAKIVGTRAAGDLYFGICDDAAGSPDPATISLYGASSSTLMDEMKLVYAGASGAAKALTSGTTYWLLFYDNSGTAPDANNCFVLVSDGAGSGEKINDDLAGAFSAGATGKPYYRIEEAGKEFRGHFAELRGALYCGAEFTDSTVSKVYINGAAGTATAGAVGYLRDTNNASILNNYFDSGIIRIMGGTGHHLPSPWRPIYDTLSANSEIQVTPNWWVAPDNTSEYAIVGSDRWIEVTGHGFGAGIYITDALAINGAIYWARGPGAVIKRLRTYFSGATYWQWADESGYATFLDKLVDAVTNEVWAAHRTLPAQIQKASGADCTGTGAVGALTFAAINCGDLGEKITGLQIYGEDTPQLYTFKEGSVYRVVNEVPQELRISGLRSAADERNGASSGVNGVYLYFSFLDTILRYYSGALDDIGPNRDGGLPANRRGMASAFLPYMSGLYVAWDGGNSNYSSIIYWNNQGWHEVWRAPYPGKRILGKLYIQPVPGDNCDRLYFTWNGNIISLTVAGNPYELNSMGTAETFQYYCYCPGGSLETGWFHYGLEEVAKLFNAVTIVGRNLSSSQSRVYLDYKIDGDTSWTYAGLFSIANDVGEIVLDDTTHNVTGKRIRLRLRLETLYNNSTPKITAIILEGLITIPSKQKMTLTFRLGDYDEDLNGNSDDYTDADTKLAQLRTWAAAAGTVGMSGCIDELNGLRVKLDYTSLRVVKHEVEEINQQKANRYVCQVGAWVID